MKATKAQLRQEIAQLRLVGARLSNIAFNVGQESAFKEVPIDVKESMRRAQREWDAIPRSEPVK